MISKTIPCKNKPKKRTTWSHGMWIARHTSHFACYFTASHCNHTKILVGGGHSFPLWWATFHLQALVPVFVYDAGWNAAYAVDDVEDAFIEIISAELLSSLLQTDAWKMPEMFLSWVSSHLAVWLCNEEPYWCVYLQAYSVKHLLDMVHGNETQCVERNRHCCCGTDWIKSRRGWRSLLTKYVHLYNFSQYYKNCSNWPKICRKKLLQTSFWMSLSAQKNNLAMFSIKVSCSTFLNSKKTRCFSHHCLLRRERRGAVVVL